MDYVQAVQYHEDAKQYGSMLGLSRIRELMRRLGDVWRELSIVHIAGTNGKGSVCCFLASVLKEAGYTAGQFYSPAVFGLREVYQINGEWIGRKEYASCMEEAAAACQKMVEEGFSHPTVFELETAVAFLWFFRRKCDIVLLEVGMGGRTDATNIIQKPLCSVFTPISIDHTQFLGNSPAEIAEVKSKIIKEGCPVVSAKQPSEVRAVLRRRAEEKNAAYYDADDITEYRIQSEKLCFLCPGIGELKLSMTGVYQVQNASLAIKTLQILGKCGYPAEKKQIIKGMECAKWPGRFERLIPLRAGSMNHPCLIIDGAHNASGAAVLKASLEENFPGYRRIGIMGVMADKPYEEMAGILKRTFEKIFTVTPKHPRALPAETLMEVWQKKGICAEAKQSISDAVKAACEEAVYREVPDKNRGVLVIAFGSLYYLREVRDIFYEITGN